LESIMLLGLAGILVWFVLVGRGFLPAPAPTAAPPTPAIEHFDGGVAYQHVLDQVGFGPRPTGSTASRQTGDYIIGQLEAAGWAVEVQEFTYMATPARNIIGRAGDGPIAIIGAHYDTRRRADNDPDSARRADPVMGANDGASGVAVLLELARVLDRKALRNQVWLAFFDAEDNGRLDGWEFIAGSRYMAEHLSVTPAFVIVADMIGDADQQIYQERTSTPALQDRVWAIAEQLGYQDYFLPEAKWSMLDDHTPFLQLGIPALDLIDFDYPYWHTVADTADKVAPAALERVGRVLETLLEGG